MLPNAVVVDGERLLCAQHDKSTDEACFVFIIRKRIGFRAWIRGLVTGEVLVELECIDELDDEMAR